MTTTKFATEQFTCPSCIKKIEGTVGKMPGVDDVNVRFNSSTVLVTFDETQTSNEQISSTIVGLGYPVTGMTTVK